MTGVTKRILLGTLYHHRLYRAMAKAPMPVWKFYTRFDPMNWRSQ